MTSYLYMNNQDVPAAYERVKAGRKAFKNFARLNQLDKKCFFELVSQALLYVYTLWCNEAKSGGLPPNF